MAKVIWIIEGPLENVPYMAVWETEKGFNAPELLVLSEEDILGQRLARPGLKIRNPDVVDYLYFLY